MKLSDLVKRDYPLPELARELGVNVRPEGDEFKGHCPFHPDEDPSFSIYRAESGEWRYKCFGCGASGTAIDLLAQLRGMTARGAINELAGRLGLSKPKQKRRKRRSSHVDKPTRAAEDVDELLAAAAPPKPTRQRHLVPPITVEALARAKGLPPDFLRGLGLQDTERGVVIPYYLADGTPAPRNRLRTALKASLGSSWDPPKGPEPVPYGLWRLEEARAAGYLILVEGESDAWTLWYHGFPALGLPGASTTQKLELDYLLGIGQIFAIREPDAAGAKFVEGLVRRLGQIRWTGELREVTLPEKDPNALHLQDPDGFPAAMRRALEVAEAVNLGSDLQEALPGAPVPSGAVVPPGWEVTPEGVWRLQEGKDGELRRQRVAPAPVLLVARHVDTTTGDEALEVAWARGGGWKTEIVDRSILLNARRLPDLAARGFPVTSGRAGALVEYLDAFEAANLTSLPVRRTTSHLGWQGPIGAPEAFVLGGGFPDADIRFRGRDAGDWQVSAGFRAAGSYEEWLEAAKIAARYPKARLAIYVSLAAPLLEITGAAPFVVDWANRTSTGKTTVLRLAASCWGNPDETAPEGVVKSWDTTRVGLERLAALSRGIPMFLDDTKRARKREAIAETLYLVANGRGRSRGTTRGLDVAAAWRTILLSTGEAPAVSATQDGGTRTRVLTISGPPFGGQSDETRREVERLNRIVNRNFGHAGPMFVRWLLERRDQWPLLATQLDALSAHYADRLPGRLAADAALINLAALLAHEALKLPWPYDEPFGPILDEIAAESEDPVGEMRALELVVTWAAGNEAGFWGRHETWIDGDPRRPPGGWLGRWDRDARWDCIAFRPDVLHRVLEELGYESEAILRAWHERGWLIVDGDRSRYTRLMRLGAERARLIAVSRAAAELVLNGGDSGDAVVTKVVTRKPAP